MIKKVLVANRGEIAIRVFRACFELGLETVAIFAKEDENSVHRFKADESYLVGEGKKPVEAYLDIEDIIRIAKDTGADAIHPGYGFLSENVDFARRCQEEGIIFIGPKVETLDMFGDKVKAKKAARAAGIREIPGTPGPVESVEEVRDFAKEAGYPIMVKAANGGGGRGMRVVRSDDELEEQYETASNEALKAFGSGVMYAEKYIANPKHIEVQILGDQHGHVMHLWERDCSVQRRHQKVVEVAPTVGLPMEVRHEVCDEAVRLMSHVGYQNAGTVEFLLDGHDFYFIEVNPRVQVEHTISEEITGVDIVKAQIRIADGESFEAIGLPKQEDLPLMGYAIQCRITTEDPANNFFPDTGKINTYRSPGGFGLRLDAGNGYQNAEVSPYYDSMVTKLIAHAMTFEETVAKMTRALREYRIRGVKNNIPFLLNVVRHEEFLSGQATTLFIDHTPSLFEFPKEKNRDRGNKILRYIAETTINGFPGLKRGEKPHYTKAQLPKDLAEVTTDGPTAKQVLDQDGVKAVQDFVKNKQELLLTDTTMRDAHQSLIATRMRTRDMVKAAQVAEEANPNFFSMEVWGGATFDTAYRFLTEDPWERLEKFRQAMPNTLLQMLFRGSNAVGYTAYPDNVLEAFIKQSAASGIDVFRVFDSLNWIKQIEKPLQFVKDTGKIAEAAMCYTGDVLNPDRQKYSTDYYVNFAKDLVSAGADIIAIKDMAGLLKPQAAYALISELKAAVDVPIHLHTHDTAGNGIITYAEAARAGVDIVDVATSAFSSTTSQPSMTTLYYALEHDDRRPALNVDNAQKMNHYWSGVRAYYNDFASGLKVPETEIYKTEMPGGQYTNLQQQAIGVGLEDRWEEIKVMYHDVNMLFGDIVKVTPSSKVVGDMALFMVQNKLSIDDFFERGKSLDFPDSVIKFFQGDLGQPVGGFPKDVQEIILKGAPATTERPGALLDPVDFDAVRDELAEQVDIEITDQDLLAYLMYPKVFVDYCKKLDNYSDLSNIDTPTFFRGMQPGETVSVEIQKGKVLRIKLIQVGAANHLGERIVYFDLNGQRREITVKDTTIKTTVALRPKADPSNRGHIGATMPGTIVKVSCEQGDKVKVGQTILVTEAMKMETTVKAPVNGTIKAIHVQAGDQVDSNDLLIEIEKD
ncbi:MULTISPECIES: pyruvate carboxylase [Aerococcus]|uniref:pyruvate carboxylase n=2 Tax=Aerococcaceae TaxID=186827 RepID=UPI000A8C0410|nr:MULTISPECIES: pyruvate carboxylase [Aerococcus]MDK6369735.1 pyruvate carboxylase [Aerococcus sp. UMB9870]MDK6680375.1 pyruvate carboxylase [Aerococcus sp. UMB8608]MDK6686954.1 pyruvate carboxylase [Aerococcus sp. UMB8623]MDK6940066.1 pyruvate carboxylase [Aerococcus sp. UMB8487]